MTSIFIIYKYRNAQGTRLLARLVEACYDKERVVRSTNAYNDMLSSKEKDIGWSYDFQEVDILDKLKEEEDGSKSTTVD